VRFTKIPWFEDQLFEKPSEPIFQTINVPLATGGGQPGFDSQRLKIIRLRFDRSPAGVVILSKIGFE
jgi:hypothetical protein